MHGLLKTPKLLTPPPPPTLHTTTTTSTNPATIQCDIDSLRPTKITVTFHIPTSIIVGTAPKLQMKSRTTPPTKKKWMQKEYLLIYCCSGNNRKSMNTKTTQKYLLSPLSLWHTQLCSMLLTCKTCPVHSAVDGLALVMTMEDGHNLCIAFSTDGDYTLPTLFILLFFSSHAG